nr:DUF4375 domain-containing protein [uncultured Mucilaginibacter sp.]
MRNLIDPYSEFDSVSHLSPLLEKSLFDSAHGWDLGWLLLEPINIATGRDEDRELSKRFSPGQKALYFFWYLDAEVTNGGFVQFYWNGYRPYLPAIVKGLELIGDDEMLELVYAADSVFLENETFFKHQMRKGDWSPLYEKIAAFEDCDTKYYGIHDNTMDKIEDFARKNPSEFGSFD